MSAPFSVSIISVFVSLRSAERSYAVIPHFNIARCTPVSSAANIFYIIAFRHLTAAAYEWWKELCAKQKEIPTWMGYVVADVITTDTPLSIREQISGYSNAQQWSVAGMELYQVGNTIWREYESEEWKQDEKVAPMAALRKGGQIRGPEKPVILWRNICKASGRCCTVISNALSKTRTQLGPSSILDYRAGFTLSRFYTTF